LDVKAGGWAGAEYQVGPGEQRSKSTNETMNFHDVSRSEQYEKAEMTTRQRMANEYQDTFRM
jgi:hypothetical protein